MRTSTRACAERNGIDKPVCKNCSSFRGPPSVRAQFSLSGYTNVVRPCCVHLLMATLFATMTLHAQSGFPYTNIRHFTLVLRAQVAYICVFAWSVSACYLHLHMPVHAASALSVKPYIYSYSYSCLSSSQVVNRSFMQAGRQVDLICMIERVTMCFFTFMHELLSAGALWR